MRLKLSLSVVRRRLAPVRLRGRFLTNTAGTAQLAVLQGWVTDPSWTAGDFNTWLTTGVLSASDVSQRSVNGSYCGLGVDNNNLNTKARSCGWISTPTVFRWRYRHRGGFDGANVGTTLTVKLVGFAQTEQVAYVIHYADGTIQSANDTVANLAGADLTMTLGTSGKFIDTISNSLT